MKKIICLIATISFTLAAGSISAKGKKADESDNQEVTVSHNGDFDLYIPVSALFGHLNHGDCIVAAQDTSSDGFEAAISKAGYDIDSLPFCEVVEKCYDEEGNEIPCQND